MYTLKNERHEVKRSLVEWWVPVGRGRVKQGENGQNSLYTCMK
jgi:hypothetical protein